MSRRIVFAGLLAFLCVSAYVGEAEARRGSGFSRSGGSRSFGRGSAGGSSPSRSTWGSARPDGHTSGKGGVFGSQRSSRGAGFTSSRGTRLSRSAGTPAARAERATTYQRSYSQPTTVINHNYYGGGAWGSWGWGMHSVGMWDLFFLSTVSHAFWYHHWNDASLQRALYQDNLLEKAELQKLEARVKELEAQGVARDPNYLPDGVDPDLAHAKPYVDQNPDKFYGDDEPTAKESGSGLWTLMGVGALAALVYFVFVRRA